MDRQFYGSPEFGFEIIASGSFADDGYLVTSRVIRLNRMAMYTYRVARRLGDETLTDRQSLILELLGVDLSNGWPNGTSVTPLISEIFAVVTMERLADDAVG